MFDATAKEPIFRAGSVFDSALGSNSGSSIHIMETYRRSALLKNGKLQLGHYSRISAETFVHQSVGGRSIFGRIDEVSEESRKTIVQFTSERDREIIPIGSHKLLSKNLPSSDDEREAWRVRVHRTISFLSDRLSLAEVGVTQISTRVAGAKGKNWSGNFQRDWIIVAALTVGKSGSGRTMSREGPVDQISNEELCEMIILDEINSHSDVESGSRRAVFPPRMAAIFLEAIVNVTKNSDLRANLISDSPSVKFGGLSHEWDWKMDPIGRERRLSESLRHDAVDTGYVRPVPGRPIPQSALWNVHWTEATGSHPRDVIGGDRVEEIGMHIADSILSNDSSEISLRMSDGSQRRVIIGPDWQPEDLASCGPASYFNVSNSASFEGKWMSLVV